MGKTTAAYKKIRGLSKKLSLLSVSVIVAGAIIFSSAQQAAATTYSMWTNGTTPTNTSESDSASVELGVKFRSSVSGKVTGVRFYKGTGNGGSHTGSLWSRAGAKLATVTFSNETASGWQQALFATPVNITANTTYVVSYHAPQGHYADDVNYFASSATTNGPLTFLKNGTDGANGVYKYGAGSVFPNQTYSSSNYWVDVVFDDNSTPPDTTPPTVSVVSPVNGATSVATNVAPTATFSESLNAATVTTGNAVLKDAANNTVTATVSYNSANKQVVVTPTAALANSATYSITLTTGIKDVAGNALTAPYVWSFTTVAPADTTPPTVSSVTPVNGSTGVSATATASAVFSEALNAATVTSSTFTVRDNLGTAVAGSVSYNSGASTAVFTPASNLANNTTYTATLTTGIKDVAGNTLAAPYSWSFTTAAGVAGPVDPLAQGHGGPILVVTNTATSPLNNYYSEILRAEGVNSFAAADVSDLSSNLLAQYDVVLLGDIPLSDTQVSLLTSWVNGGGNLVAMHPDKKLASLLGLTDQSNSLAEGYLKVDTTSAPGAGIVGETIQFHGTADAYTANAGTKTVATLYANATLATSNPAVTMRSVGSNGGHAAAFTYDLARSVTRSHQGNPAWNGINRDGYNTIRPNDLFFGASATDPQADYVNLDKVAIPQADEQQRLLTNLIAEVNKDKKPLAKLWYFPNGSKAVVVMAGDDHGGSGAANVFNNQIAASPAGCVVDDWQCVRSSALMYTNSSISPAQAATYNSQGFEMGIHVNPPDLNGAPVDSGCGSWAVGDVTGLGNAFDNDLNAWRAMYPALPNQTTTRNHCAAWADYSTSAKVEAARGLRLDLNYYYWSPEWVQNRPGFFTGSGIPMRFTDTDGSFIDVYQVPTHLVNESNMTWPDKIGVQLDRAVGPEGYYGALGTHYDYRGDNFEGMLVQQAQQRGVPLVSGKQMQTWTDARNNSYYSNEVWNGSNYTFTANIDAAARSMMKGMVPITSGNKSLQTITKDGVAVSFQTQLIKGVQYAFFTATSGNYVAAYAADTTAPTVTSANPANGATGVAITGNVTANFSEAMDPATVNTGSVELLDASNAVVASAVSYNQSNNTVTVDPNASLVPNASYTLRVHGTDLGATVKDVAGNSLASTFTSSFTTGANQISLWQPTVPSGVNNAAGDTGSVELGVRFTSSQAGSISGIAFYKSGNDLSSHTMTLWDPNGVALGTASTANETASGWQVATFATPIAIAANTTYTASYHAPVGNYSYTYQALASPVTNGPLTALANGGVYLYGNGMPTNVANASSYWVDVIFNP